MTPKYLGIPAFAEYVGLKVATIRGYLTQEERRHPFGGCRLSLC